LRNRVARTFVQISGWRITDAQVAMISKGLRKINGNDIKAKRGGVHRHAVPDAG
jgi:hypothetical protein